MEEHFIFKKQENPEGQYIDGNGNRFDILFCHEALGAGAEDFVEFESLEEALETWGLTEVENGL